MNTPPPGLRPHTDRAALLRDFQSFIVNQRPIQQALMPVNADAPPIVVLAADAAFRDLVRLHMVDTPPDGGDVRIDHRMMIDGPRGLAKIALRFQWWMPAVYKMTLVLHIPKHTPWLLAALKAGGAWCQDAPIDPFRPVIWLPIDVEQLTPHILSAAALLSVQTIRPTGRKVA
jgi:hypothetical protein